MSSSSNWKVLLPGIPANSTRGFLGWCNVSLIKFTGKNEYALFDTGNNGDRKQLLSALQVSGITPSRINHLILSHLHMTIFSMLNYLILLEYTFQLEN